MATRATYTFEDSSGEHVIYKHYDGYPAGALAWIYNALEYSWDLPRFEADEFASAFCVGVKVSNQRDNARSLTYFEERGLSVPDYMANPCHGGGVRLFKKWDQAWDIEYTYRVTCKDGALWVEGWETRGGFGGEPFHKGTRVVNGQLFDAIKASEGTPATWLFDAGKLAGIDDSETGGEK